MKVHPFLLVAIWFLALSGSAQQVTELHYKLLDGNGKTLEGPDFVYGQSFLKIQTKPAHSRNPARYIDKKGNLVIMCYDSRSRDYIVEELDSIYRVDTELKDMNEEKVINGYRCHKYETHRILNFNYGVFAIPASVTATYKSTLWITADLSVDDSYGVYISHALFPLVATFPFKGVIVKVECESTIGKKEYTGEIILDSLIKNKEPEQDFVRPWAKKDPVAILPGESSSSAATLKYTRESSKDYYFRMKALLIKVTGLEKPKYKTGFEGIFF
jgi:hypothetical protein